MRKLSAFKYICYFFQEMYNISSYYVLTGCSTTLEARVFMWAVEIPGIKSQNLRLVFLNIGVGYPTWSHFASPPEVSSSAVVPQGKAHRRCYRIICDTQQLQQEIHSYRLTVREVNKNEVGEYTIVTLNGRNTTDRIILNLPGTYIHILD